MSVSICGIDCSECPLKDTCAGCAETGGRPFGGKCTVAECCKSKGCGCCCQCTDATCALKEELIAEFNALGIADMTEVTELNALRGSYINLEYTFPSGQTVKLLDDDKIYLGNQICKPGGVRCYGLAADEGCLLVCEYGPEGADPELVIYKRR